MLSGTVKWFNETKGYGFILGTEGADVFVHYSQIAGGGFRTLREGEAVEYEAEKGPKGLHAMRVMRREPTS